MFFMLKVLGWLILSCVSLWCSSGWASEVLIKIANVPDVVLQKHILSRGRVFASQPSAVLDLGHVLDTGLGFDNESTMERPSVDTGTFLEKRFREARLEIRNLFFSMGSLIGRQRASNNSGWNKFIISFQGEDHLGDYILEVGSEREEISHVAVANQRGTYDLWQISTKPPSQGDTATVFRIRYSDFVRHLTQDDARTWFYDMFPGTSGVGVMVITQDSANAFPSYSDTALIWIQRSRLMSGKQGLPTAAVVIGWRTR